MQQKIKQGENIQRPVGRETCQEPNSPGQTVQAKTKMNSTGIPEGIKQKYESISGFSFSDVQVHYNSHKPAQLQALAYTQGNDVYMAPGQERHLEHELGHVVQQKAGMVTATTSIGGMAVNDDPELERQADRIGRPMAQMKREPVIQRMRLCLNSNPEDAEIFKRVRRVPVSPKADKEIPDTLAPLLYNLPEAEAVIAKNYGNHNEPGEGKYTLESDEDIVVEAHGIDLPEGTSPDECEIILLIALYAVKFLSTCGYSAEDPWNGRVVWFGCSTGAFSQILANMISSYMHFPVRVVGTKKSIYVPTSSDGSLYAAEDWEADDPNAPVNCAEILTFNHALTEASFLDNLLNAQNVALKIKKESSIDEYTADESDMAELKRLIGEFQALTLPPQPAYVDFTGKSIPAELQRRPIENNKIKLPPCQVSDIKASIVRGLCELENNMQNLKLDMISNNLVKILVNINGILKFVNYFSSVAHRKIDFNNPDDVIEAIGVIPAPAQPGQAEDPGQLDAGMDPIPADNL